MSLADSHAECPEQCRSLLLRAVSVAAIPGPAAGTEGRLRPDGSYENGVLMSCESCVGSARGHSGMQARCDLVSTTRGLLHEYIGHDVSNMRGFDSYRLLTLSLAALMTRISSVVIEGAHTSAGAATLARTVPFWGRFRSPREPTAGPCRGCLLPSATNTAPSRHHLQAVLCDGWDVQTPPSWLLRPQTRELYGWS